MRYLKRAVTVSFFFLLIGVAHAGEDLTINADDVEYNKEKGYVEAIGSVVATYEEIRVDAPHLIYFSDQRRIVADRGFVMTTGEQRVSGKKLYYSLLTKTGTAEDVKFDFRGTHLKGKTISMSPDLVVLGDSAFTSCGREPPDYHFTASNVTLHPKIGWFAAYWGWFYLGPLPILPVPTYLYDMGPSGKRTNVAPIPEFGTNDVDGNWVRESFAWAASERVYGKFSLTYAEKKGPGAGIGCNWLADDVNRYYARVYTVEKDGWGGGLTYDRSLDGEVDKRMLSDSYSLFDLPKTKKMDLEVDVSSRERINYYHISALPDIALIFNEDLWGNNVEYGGEARWGRILEEETTLEAYRSTLSGHFTYRYPLMPEVTLVCGSGATGRWYSDSSIWNQISGFTEIDNSWTDDLDTDYGYRHLFINEGGSPFAFEQYWFRPDDQIYAGAQLKLARNKLGVNIEYYVPSWDLKDVDYSFSLRLHCMDVTLTYRVMRKEFGVGFGLVPEK